jgi:hypothetical protein
MLSFGDNIFFNLPCEYATSTTYKKSMLYLNKDWKKKKFIEIITKCESTLKWLILITII